VEFPSAEKVNEAAIYEWVPLRGAQIYISVKKWSSESLAYGKLSVVWVHAKRVLRELKNFHGMYEVGSTIGFVLEVDMETAPSYSSRHTIYRLNSLITNLRITP
jgi:hypothetical protein